eukprot:CAMPEP_0113849948 /NCGR_PEP_ID=MMETSP0372-20130328/3498_1 /TAXON_ID=340204 /ORGANISM="Lankesteria abbotti" /LENGTH=137 /DNA_ID=CAMNT_0000819963 /DNA_START=58 /DNA_END=468 /DNA_ORIENTATION=+ /assembly_acc=CAM_ASM_000359
MDVTGGCCKKPGESWRSRIISQTELEENNTEDKCWIAVNGVVMDLTDYINEHPGGPDIIAAVAGTDASKEFRDVGHSGAADRLAMNYAIGVLEGHDPKTVEGTLARNHELNMIDMQQGCGGAGPMGVVMALAVLGLA